MSNPAMLLPPGFRFHPTDEELILHYLRKRTAALPCPVSIIAEVDIYKFDPWDLPERAMFGDREWYFFSPRDRKYPNGVRPNRAARSGYWKATGTDKPIVTSKGKENIGVKKALVFYRGKPPKGVKTEWIMHEYRLTHEHGRSNYKPVMRHRDSSMRLDDWVLCRIYKKSSHQEPEKEPSSPAEDVFIPTPASTGLPKSYSLSELLNAVDYSEISRLLEFPGLESNSLGFPNFNPEFPDGSNYSSDSSSYLFQPFSEAESSAFKTESSLKRQWSCFEDSSELSPTEKKPKWERPDSQSAPFLNQKLILNSHLI